MNNPPSYESKLEKLKSLGFEVPEMKKGLGVEAQGVLDNWHSLRSSLDYDIDGVVCRIDDEQVYEGLGLNGSRTKPLGAYAMKFPTVGVMTEIIDIEWSDDGGRFMSPVAILKPTIMENSVVRRVRVKAVDVYDKKIGVGSVVELHMAGEVIPHVKRIMSEPKDYTNEPKTCSYCESPLHRENTGLVCPLLSCPNKEAHRIVDFLKAVRIKGCGLEVARQAVDEGIGIEMIMEKRAPLLRHRFVKNWAKVVAQIASTKAPLSSLLKGSPIVGFGLGGAIRISEASPRIEDLRASSDPLNPLHEKLNAVLTEGNRVNFWAFITSDLFPHLSHWLQEETTEYKGDAFDLSPKSLNQMEGLVVCMTGSPDGYHKKALESHLLSLGAIIKPSVTKKTDLLYASITTSSKAVKAESLGIEVLPYPKSKGGLS